jgi:hypothetical protein
MYPSIKTSEKLRQQLSKARPFWDTQPVPKNVETLLQLPQGPLELGDLSKVRQEPYNLLDMFEWCEVDLNNEDVMK